MTSIVPELQSLAPSAIIELFELHTSIELHGSSEIYRFHSGANQRVSMGDIIWNGKRYQRFPIEAEGFEYNGQQLPRPKLRVSNLFSTITSVLLNVNEITPGNDLIGAKVIRIRTCARYLDAINFEGNQNPYGSPDPTAEAPREIYFIDRKVTENRDFVEFELAAAIDLMNVKLPARQCISSVCQWEYRSPECGYTGTAAFDENDNPSNLVSAPNFASGISTMSAGQTLNPNEFLVSPNRWYKAVMQDDGNFVVYNKALKAVWSTLTYDKGPSRFVYQEDGNLVVYDAYNRATWNSNTQNQAAITSLEFTKLIPEEYPSGDDETLQLVPAPNFTPGTSSVTSSGSGFKLYPGESLTSANGWYRLLMQRDGNLVVYNKANAPVWQSATGQPSFAWFQPDGNLVVYRYSDNAAIFSAQAGLLPTSTTPAANFPTGSGVITAGNTNSSKLFAGQSLYSENGWYRLTMQLDGNLVITNKGNIVTWQSVTGGSGATYAHFQDDGNFVLYDNAGVPKWKSNNGSYPQFAGKKLYLQKDGNLVIYGTGLSSTTLVPAPNLQTGTGAIAAANAESSKLFKGQSVYSENGWYRLTMETNGNLAIYNKAGAMTWSSGTAGTAAHYAYFQGDGNLVLYDNTGVGGTGNPVWFLNRQIYPQFVGTRWKLERDGELRLYNSTNGIVWRSNTGTQVEPSVPQTGATADVPLWHTATGSLIEPGNAVYPLSTLALSDTGTLSISSNGVSRWSNGYGSTEEPKVEQETGDNRQHVFLWEIFGRADTQQNVTKNVTRTFTQGDRSITFRFNGTANFALPAKHYSGEKWSWTLNSAVYLSSTGKWYLDEWVDIFIDSSRGNPFRKHPEGNIGRTGRQYRVLGVLSSAGILRLQDDGNLVQYDVNNSAIWNTGYYTNIEPKIPGNGTGGRDVCGKRLSSCRLRFGDNTDLPFGSFPGVGQFFA